MLLFVLLPPPLLPLPLMLLLLLLLLLLVQVQLRLPPLLLPRYDSL